jgi:AGZA family xanthine/uracil permease-like MFS transporter
MTEIKTNLKTEIIAGITTFLTMSYIIVVNPAILSTEGTGMSFSGVMTGTILISAFCSILMGAWARLPLALAPGMGLNAFFTYTLILTQKIPWPTALGMVFWSGVFFVVISMTPLREKIVQAIPKHLKWAMSCGIGIFLAFIGFKNAFLVKSHPVTFVTYDIWRVESLFAILGLVIILFFLRKKNPASYLIGIFIVTVLALLIGKISWPTEIVSAPDFTSVIFKADIWGALKLSLLPSIMTLMITDLFDSISTLVGVCESAQLLDAKGEPKNAKKALLVDAIATMLSGPLGSSAATAYIESSAGISVGGRTGLTAIIAGILFLPFLFFSPLAQIVPAYATAPVLIIVGFLMLQNISRINFSILEDLIPAALIILLIPLTFSITHGILIGIFFHIVLYFIFGRRKEIHPLLYIIAIFAFI